MGTESQKGILLWILTVMSALLTFNGKGSVLLPSFPPPLSFLPVSGNVF
jgi:hypothetical protein